MAPISKTVLRVHFCRGARLRKWLVSVRKADLNFNEKTLHIQTYVLMDASVDSISYLRCAKTPLDGNSVEP